MKKLLLTLLGLFVIYGSYAQTTYTVTNLSDDPSNTGSLRYQINQANQSAGIDSIVFAPGSFGVISVDSNFTITDHVIIFGADTANTVISASNSFSAGIGVFTIDNAAAGPYRIENMKIRAATADNGSGISQINSHTNDTVFVKHVVFQDLDAAVQINGVAANNVVLEHNKFINCNNGYSSGSYRKSVLLNGNFFDQTRGTAINVLANDFDIFNNIVINTQDNGGLAVVVSDPESATMPCRLRNNTIVDNLVRGLVINEANTYGGMINLSNNIIFNNTPADFSQQGGANFGSYTKNIVGTTDGTSTTNPNWYDSGDPNLSGFELTSNSTTAIDSANAGEAPPFDHFGNPRGASPDIGAVEFTCGGFDIIVDSYTNVTCNGGTDGQAYISVSGGISPYSYSWSNGESTQNALNLPAGSNTLTVEDDNGCTTQEIVVITEPTAIIINEDYTVDVLCAGDATGTAGMIVTGGTPGYVYNWDNGETTLTAYSLMAGSTNLNVTDANGCPAMYTVIINEPPVLTITSTPTDVSCNGGSDGTITIVASGGVGPYIYSTDGQNYVSSSTFSGLMAQNYTASVQDSNGCFNSEFITINEPTALTHTTTSTDVSCAGNCNGLINVSANGGVSPYSYSYDGGSTFSNDPFSNALCTGNYNVVVKDANFCTSTNFEIINEPTSLTINLSTTNTTCFGFPDGSITATVTGGISPYTYSWTSGGTSATETGLAAGNYTVTATDNNGCQIVMDTNVYEPDQIFVNVDFQTDATCFGLADGSASMIVTGGTPGYTYLWSGGQTVQSPTDLAGGQNDVTVTDANGCTGNQSVTISEPAEIILNNNITNVSCFNQCDGLIDIVATGGTSPYTYSIDGGQNSSPNQMYSGLCANSYNVVVYDVNQCASSFYNATITEPSAIFIDENSVTITDESCGQNDGSITGLTVSGGLAPYSYSWQGGQHSGANNIDLSNAGTGTAWILTVTDDNGCSEMSSAFNIQSQGAAITSTVTPIDASCFASFDGSASISTNGGTAPYTYTWSNGLSGSSTQVSNLSAGSYWVNTVDANGCSGIQEVFTINEPSEIITSEIITPATCGLTDGEINLSTSGGTAPYTYSWSQIAINANSNIISNLTSGSYQVVIVDANGCSMAYGYNVPSNDFTITNTSTNTSCFDGNDGSIDITATPSDSYTYSWSNGESTEDLSNLNAGYYEVTVSNAACTQTVGITITSPDAITLLPSSTPASGCFTPDGVLNLSATGGTGATTFELFDDQSSIGTGATYSNLFPGGYLVITTDANGCVDSSLASVSGTTSGAPLFITLNNATTSACLSSDPSQPGNGTANVSVSGGQSPYIYRWNKYTNSAGQGLGTPVLISTAETPTNLSAGNYVLEVEDANGCKSYLSLSIGGANLAPQEICMVTVDVDAQNNQQNIIVWEKNQGQGIDYYEIWRLESNGTWQLRDTINFESLSQYIDNGVDPNQSFYSYQLRTIDECGFQSIYTSSHETIFLDIDTNSIVPGTNTTTYDGSVDMQWNQYGGDVTITDYNIRRIIVENSVTIEDSIIHTRAYDLNTQIYFYTDNSLPGDNGSRSIFYYVEAVFPSVCSATKAQDYNGTRSNRSRGVYNGGGLPTSVNELNEKDHFAIYPNPSKGVFILETNQGGGEIIITDVFGRIVHQSAIHSIKTKVDLSHLPNGAYFLNYLEGVDKNKVEKLIIQQN